MEVIPFEGVLRMRKWIVVAVVVLLVISVAGVWLGGRGEGSGGSVMDLEDSNVLREGVAVAPFDGEVEVSPTSTPWPTFTPLPTPTLTPVPPTPTPTVVWPTFTPLPTEPALPVVLGTPAVATEVPVTRMPTPTPYGRYPGEELFFLQQSVFPLQVGEFPDYVIEGRWDELPKAYEVISSRAKFVAWVVLFDSSKMEVDSEVRGFVRWMDVTPGWEPIVMLENEVVLTKELSVFYTALGNVRPGVWNNGVYRVVFLDKGLNEVVSWDFEVR